MLKQEIIFHIGPRKCGKSEFAENELSIYEKKLYIATLPDLAKYNETILDHQTRRGSNWDLFVITENLSNDISNIRKILANYPTKKSACLLDGILTWFRILNNNQLIIENVEILTREIINLILDFQISWRLVEVSPSIFLDWNNPNARDYYLVTSKIIRNILNGIGSDLKLINWTNGSK